MHSTPNSNLSLNKSYNLRIFKVRLSIRGNFEGWVWRSITMGLAQAGFQFIWSNIKGIDPVFSKSSKGFLIVNL